MAQMLVLRLQNLGLGILDFNLRILTDVWGLLGTSNNKSLIGIHRSFWEMRKNRFFHLKNACFTSADACFTSATC